MADTYVIIAVEDERVRECIVVTDYVIAKAVFQRCRHIYGGANVALCSRTLNRIPDNILRDGVLQEQPQAAPSEDHTFPANSRYA